MASYTSAKPIMLHREIGVFGATFMGLGSILGAGVFVSLAVAAGVAGPWVVLATVLAALVALCNASSSAQLAATHPVSGGAYEYGYHYLNPTLGFTAGWTFLCAKCASAATAALGFSGYALNLISGDGNENRAWLAIGAVGALTIVCAAGVRFSNVVNTLIVCMTLVALATFVAAVAPSAWNNARANLWPAAFGGWGTVRDVLNATALMFVAYTGYGRIATLGEEVHEPRKTIPTAIVAALGLTAIIYLAIATTAVGAAGAGPFGQSAQTTVAPLESVARNYGLPGLHVVVAMGAITAMLGVLLNLILGLSRVLLAMGRRRDAPSALATLNASATTPYVAVCTIGVAVAALTLIDDVRTTWSFSAFSVLVYYAITNLAALRLPAGDRVYSRRWAWGGLLSCLFLAFWVEPRVWLVGVAVVGAGLLWHLIARRMSLRRAPPATAP